jgi:AcrR family transcriptional regulator
MTANASPTRMTAARRRQQLLDVTSEIVAEQGFRGVSIQSVARRAGLSRPIVYEHFGGLQGLLVALVEHEMAQALAQISQTELPDLTVGDPVELMFDSLRRYLDAVERHPRTWRLVLMTPEGAPELLRKGIGQGRAAVLNRLTRAVGPGFARAGEAPDPELTARMLSAAADEYARMLLTDPTRFPRERLLEHARWYLQHLSS